MQKDRKRMGRKRTAWFLLLIMGINSFGGSIPAVRAADYGRTGEEAESQIQETERAADIPVPDDGEIDQADPAKEEQMAEGSASKPEVFTENSETVYEDMWISSDTALSEDIEVGSLTIRSPLHLKGHKVVVHGDVNLGSAIYMEEGYLVVKGSLQENFRAQIITNSPNDSIWIEKDYIFNPSYEYKRTMNYGTIEVKGDIRGADNGICNTQVVFNDDCRIILSGSQMQTIDVQTNSGWNMKHLIIQNTSEEGVLSKHILRADQIEDPEQKLHYVIDGERGGVLTEDTVIQGDYCLVMGTLDLAGHSLTIQGDLILTGGEVRINGGSLTVEGDYRRQSVEWQDGKEVVGHSTGRLVMNQESDHVLVKGDYTDSGLKQTADDLTAGTMELQGSIRAEDGLDHYLLQTSGSHTLKLTGAGKQTLETGSSYQGDNFSFCNLVVDQKGTGSVEWDSDIVVTGSVDHRSGNISGNTLISGTAALGENLYGNIRIQNSYTFSKNVTIHGNLYLGYQSPYRSFAAENAHIIVAGDCFMTFAELQTSGENGKLTVQGNVKVLKGGCVFDNGSLEIKGNIEGESGTYISCGKKAEVCFAGTEEQNIEIPHMNTLFTNIVIDNPAGVKVGEDVSVINVTSKQGTLTYASGGVYGFTVEEDGEYEGNLDIAGGVLDLNGHTLHVKGSLTITGGALCMTQENDHLIVDGDFMTKSAMNHTEKLTNGILEVKGDFTQAGGQYSFAATEHHTTIFSGTKEQTIVFDNSICSCFKNVSFSNENNIVLKNTPRVFGEIRQKGTTSGVLGIGSGASIPQNHYNGDVLIINGIGMTENWIIDGNLELQSCQALDIKGKNLTVTKQVSFSKSESIIYISHGTLHCGSIAVNHADAYGLYMRYEDDNVIVDGDFTLESSRGTYFGGNMQVAGNITFLENSTIRFGEKMVLELNGTKKQTVAMNGVNHRFGHVILNNLSEDGIYVAKVLNCASLDNTAGCNVTFADGGILGYTLQKDEVVDGDMLVSGGVMDLNGHTLIIKGNLTCNNGMLLLNQGSVLVEGDFGNNTALSIQNGTMDLNGNWNVNAGVSANAAAFSIAGDIQADGGYTFDLSKASQFLADGTKQQSFTFGSATARLGNVILKNEEGIQISQNECVQFYGDLVTNQNPIDGWVYLYGDPKDDHIKGNIYFANFQKLERDLCIDGDVDLGCLNLNGQHLTVNGDCYVGCRYNKSYEQTSGTVEVKGDIQTGDYLYFFKEGTQVILSGDHKQTIVFPNTKGGFYELVISNTSEEGVFAKNLFDAESIRDPEHKLSFSIEGDVGYTLTKDTVLQGDFTLLAGNMDLNGHKLTVLGNLYQAGGKITINKGELVVSGNYNIWNYAVLQMADEDDYICVQGDFVMIPALLLTSWIQKGTIELKGDFAFYTSNSDNQLFSEEIVFLFSGADKQVVRNGSRYNRVQLGTMTLMNTSSEGVVLTDNWTIRNPVINSDQLHGTAGKTLYWKNRESPEFVGFEGNLYIQSNVTLQRDLIVDGTLTIGSTLDLNGHHLTADTLIVNGSCMFHGGVLQVKRDIFIDGYYAELSMEQPADILQITGSLTAARGTLNLLAGQLDVKGNVNLSGAKVQTGEGHTTILSGKMNTKGTAYIQTVTLAESVKLNKLILTKPRNYYVFNRNVESMCEELLDDISDIEPPSVPAGLTAADISYTSIRLSWEPSTDDTGVAGYDIYRNDRKIMSVTGTSYTDKKLTPGTEYSYCVVAKDATLNTSAFSDPLTVAALADETAPEIPKGLALAERLGNALAIRFEPSSDNVAVAGYHIYRDGEWIGDTTTTLYTDSGLEMNQGYRYQICAYDTSGNESDRSEEVMFYTQAVEVSKIAPAEYATLSGTQAEIAVSFLNAGSTKGYQVYMEYAEKEGGESAVLLDGTYGKNTSYRSNITAKAVVDTTKIRSEEIIVTLQITDAGGYKYEQQYTYYLDKSAPSRLNDVGVEVRSGVAVISFEKGREVDLAGYRIYRQETGGEASLVLDSDNPEKTYYYDKTMMEGTEYTYYVSAYDTQGLEGEWSKGITVTADADVEAPQIESVTPLDGILTGIEKLTIRTSDNKALDRVAIELTGKEEQEDVLLETLDLETGTVTYDLDTTKLTGEITLRFTVYDKAENENEDEFLCTYTIDNQGPSAPTGLAAEIYSTTAVLSWDDPSEDDYAYAVVEQILEDGTTRQITRTTTTTGCVIEGLTPEETTTYQVTFYDKQGNRGESSEPLPVTADADTIAPRILSVSPNGGYFSSSIPLSIRAYDNCGISGIVIEYSVDQKTWETAYTETMETLPKDTTIGYTMDVSGIPEGNLYLRTYALDEAGNAGDFDQIRIQCVIDRTAPSAVDQLTAEGEAGSIHIKWNEPVDNDVAGYRLYRSIEGLNAYTCIADSIQALGYYDRTALYDTSYCYQLTAYDHAGNESVRSNTAVGQKQPDDVSPAVHSILPEKDSMIAKTVTLSAYVSDNDKVANVEFAIQGTGEGSSKLTIDTVSTGISAGTVTCSFDTEDYVNGEYELYVTARDASGNSSKALVSRYRIHNVSLDTPVLSARAGDWCVDLHCTADPSLTYVLYRRNQQTEDTYTAIKTGTGSLMYRDLNIHPRYTYVYQLVVEDEAGNRSQSVLQYVKPNAVDSVRPAAVIHANTSVIEGYQMILQGSDSTDNDRIVRYTWDFGDGSEEAGGPAPKHTFEKEGEYLVTLTVEDASGNTDYTTAKVTVLPKAGAGKAVVEVRGASGSPLRDVTIYVNSSAAKNNIAQTDKKGQAVLMENPGTYKIALYKPGYVAVEESVEIELYGERQYVFTLLEGETISADFKVRQMDFDEIVAAGIDLSNPENQHVFTVETKLAFTDAVRTPETWVSEPFVPAKPVMTGESKTAGGGGGGSSSGGGGGGGGSSRPQEEEEKEEEQTPDLYYTICITQSISWLKDMYEATLIVYNNANSQTIVAKDLTATVQLPAGLSLAATRNGQDNTLSIPDLKGGETGSATWYIRGDASGTYQLNAMLNGTLQPFDAGFTCNFTSNAFEVTAGDGLVLTICPEDRAEKGESYYVYFTLSNEGSKEFYNVHTSFGTKHENSRRFMVAADRSRQLPVMSEDDVAVVECLKPGESISGIVKRMLPVEGDKWLNYKSLVNAEYKVLAGANLGVAVHLEVVASHVPVPSLVYQEQTEENAEADPVNVSTGAYTDNITVLSVQGVNPVSADIAYDSNAATDLGEFGYGWAHNYETRLKDMKDGTVRYYVSPAGYYTFLASHYEAETIYTMNEEGYYELDLSRIPMEETFRCLNENKAGYELNRDKNGEFTLTDQAGSITHFDKKGNVTSLENKEGKAVTIKRESDQFTVTDKVTGRHLVYHLNRDKLVESVTDGKRTAYFYYNEDDCLKQFVNALGESTYYTYDKKHRILTVTNDDNVTYVTNTYADPQNTEGDMPADSVGEAYKSGRVESQKDASGSITRFSYSEDETNGSLTTTVTTRSGAKKITVTDAYGNVTSQTNEKGDTTTTTYDDDGNMTYVNQPEMTAPDSGEKSRYSIAYGYDRDGNLISISNNYIPQGEYEVRMAYDSDGNMTSMVNRNGERMSCSYYENGQIKTVTDQNGNTTTYEYNGSGQITKETDAAGQTIEYTYQKGDLVSVRDRNGSVTSYTYNKEGLVEETSVTDRVSGETYTTYTYYDELGRTSMVLDTEGGTTSYEYDCNGNLTEKTEPAGSRTVYQYDGNSRLLRESVYPDADAEKPDSTTSYTYTKEGLLETVKDGNSGVVIENRYDKAGNKTKETERKGEQKLSEKHYAYDAAGNMTKETAVCLDEGAGEADSLVTEYVYYPNGRLNRVIDSTGVETVYSYDPGWRLQTVSGSSDPTVTYAYDPAGRMIKETAGSGEEAVSTSYEYDIFGRVVKSTDARQHETNYTYDANGNLTETRDASGRVFYSRYDSLNRVVETGMRRPGSKEDIPLTYTSYRIKDHSITVTDAVNGGSVVTYYDTAGREVKTVNGDNEVLSEILYDTENRILQTVDARGMVTENVYNSLGQITEIHTGKKGAKKEDGSWQIEEMRTEKREYDDLGRTARVTDAENGVSSVVYDSFGRILSLKDPNQNAAKTPDNAYVCRYNGQGLPETVTNVLGDTVTYRYNAKLLLESMTDSAGEKTEYTYDSLNRLQKVKDDLGTIEYAYDANGNIEKVTESPKGLFHHTGTIVRTYDELNRVTFCTDYKGREVKYGYDELGNLQTLTYPGGEIVRYAYNDDGTVRTMSSSGGTFTYGYDNYGRLCRITRPDGSTEERSYDAAGQLTRQTDKDSSGSVLQENTYRYNVFGEVIEKTTTGSGDPELLATVRMEYNDANRLVKYNGQDVIYDAKGNMTYGPVDGEMTELVYDCRNRLVKAGKVSYTYDAENTRIASTEDGITTEYVTDTVGSLSRMLAAYESTGTPSESQTLYYYGPEGLAAQNNSAAGEYFAYHYDNIGSTTLITAKDGSVAERFAYGTYGELLTEPETPVRFLYNGSYGVVTDSNGLYYMRARYYNPDIRRFINQDIKTGDITDGQSLNRYAYCEGNPVSMVDPFGLCGENAGDAGEKSRYRWLHTALNLAGLVFDGADIVNAGIYAMEGRWGEAAVCIASALPVVGTAITGVTKATRYAKAGTMIGKTLQAAGKTYTTVQTATAALEMAGDARMQYAVNGGNVTPELAMKAAGAAVMGAMAVLSATSMMKDVTSLARAGDVRFETTGRDVADTVSGRCEGGTGVGCFVAGTRVKTQDGEKNIEEVEEGDYVLSEDPETGEQKYKRVVKTYIHEKYLLVHVCVEEEEITATENHPFYAEGLGFVSAGTLHAGDIVRLADGRRVPVRDVEFEYLDEPVLVYNFEVEDFHTYYVSGIGVLVHNTCEGGSGTKAFDIVEYGDKTPGLENHHGVLDVWATHNIDGYKSRASKSTTIALTKSQHDATKSVYRDWLFEKTGKRVGGKVDWKTVSPQEIQSLSERMFDAANVPMSARRNYYSEFNKYIYGLEE